MEISVDNLKFIIGCIISGGFFFWLYWEDLKYNLFNWDDTKYDFLKSLLLCVFWTLGTGWFISQIIWIPEKPKIYVDNRYDKDLDIYISKKNKNLKFKKTIKSGFFTGEFIKFNSGDNKIVMRTKNGNKIDEIDVKLDYNKVYLLNPLNISKYVIGEVNYSRNSFFEESNESNHIIIDEKFFCIEENIDYWLTPPPIEIRTSQYNPKYTYLKRY